MRCSACGREIPSSPEFYLKDDGDRLIRVCGGCWYRAKLAGSQRQQEA